jgi:hypothetical protein
MIVNRVLVRKIVPLVILIILLEFRIFSQSTYNPYSLYGYGELELGEYGMTSGMGGVAIGIQNSNFLNASNPAALSAIDSMTFLYDFSGSAKWSTFFSNDAKQKTLNSNIKRVVMGFRIARPWSIGFGMTPYSTVGYKINSNTPLEGGNGVSIADNFEGHGGINKFFITNAFSIIPHLSIGINTSFLTGAILNNESINGWNIDQNSNTGKVKFDFGMQYNTAFTKNISCVFGMIYGYGTSLIFDKSMIITDDYGTILKNESSGTINQKLPMFFGGGLSVIFNNSITLATDCQFYKSSVITSNSPGILFTDMYKIKFGAEFKNNKSYYSNYFQKINYMAGFSIGNSYLKINGNNPLIFGVSAGMTLPIKNSAFFNISVEAGRTGSAQSYRQIQENYAKLNFNIVFKDIWFMKRKYD